MPNLTPRERDRPNYDGEKCYTVSHSITGNLIDILNEDATNRNISRSYLIAAILSAYYRIPVPMVIPNNGKTKKARKILHVS